MTTRPPLAICPTVAAMTATGSFNLDDLAEHVKDCPTCQTIMGAVRPVMAKAVTDALITWPPETSKDEEQ